MTRHRRRFGSPKPSALASCRLRPTHYALDRGGKEAEEEPCESLAPRTPYRACRCDTRGDGPAVRLQTYRCAFSRQKLAQAFGMARPAVIAHRGASYLAPEVPRLLLIDEVMMSTAGWESLLKVVAEVGMGIGTWGYRWSSGPHWSVKDVPTRYLMTWPWYTGQAHRAGLFVHPWTIDDPWEMWMVTWSGADGICTNRAERALAAYGRSAPIDLGKLWSRIGY